MAKIQELQKQSGYLPLMIGLSVVTVILGAVIARSLTLKVLRLNKEVAGNRAALDAYKQKVSDLDKLKENYIKLEKEEPDFRKITLGVLPEEGEEERFLVSLKNLADSAGLNVTAIQLNAPADVGGERAFGAVLSVGSTDWKSLIGFFSLLESSSRYTTTSSISMSGSVIFKPEIKINVYFNPLEGAAGG